MTNSSDDDEEYNDDFEEEEPEEDEDGQTQMGATFAQGFTKGIEQNTPIKYDYDQTVNNDTFKQDL